jgi:hypothetical protein
MPHIDCRNNLTLKVDIESIVRRFRSASTRIGAPIRLGCGVSQLKTQAPRSGPKRSNSNGPNQSTRCGKRPEGEHFKPLCLDDRLFVPNLVFGVGEGGVAVDFCTKKHMRKGRAGSIEHGQFWHRIADREIRMIPSRCSRNRSGQSTLEPFRTTAFNSMAATHSIESSYFHSISTSINKPLKLVRDQGVGGSNPLSPTILSQLNQYVRRLSRSTNFPPFSVHSVQLRAV